MRASSSTAALALAALASGCVRTIDVEVPAAPSVSLDVRTVAVVAVDRECRAVADALVSALSREEGLVVDPAAEVRLDVFACGRSLHPMVDVEQSPVFDRRRVTVEGRAHAVVAVSTPDDVQAHLIGSGRQTHQGAWGDTDVVSMGAAVARALEEDVARDLAAQVSPMPRLVQRRWYPNASDDSARGLYNLAVRAEQSGDLSAARRLAWAAIVAAPTPTHVAYLADLDRQLRSR